MGRKTRFLIYFFVIVFVYVLPLAIAIHLKDIWISALTGLLFIFSIYIVYWFEIKKKKPKYPAVPPEGHPDIYTGIGTPRPIHEDMEQYPWLFKKKNRKLLRWTKKKVKKKKH